MQCPKQVVPSCNHELLTTAGSLIAAIVAVVDAIAVQWSRDTHATVAEKRVRLMSTGWQTPRCKNCSFFFIKFISLCFKSYWILSETFTRLSLHYFQYRTFWAVFVKMFSLDFEKKRKNVRRTYSLRDRSINSVSMSEQLLKCISAHHRLFRHEKLVNHSNKNR